MKITNTLLYDINSIHYIVKYVTLYVCDFSYTTLHNTGLCMSNTKIYIQKLCIYYIYI